MATFSGTATPPVVRRDFVVRRALLTDRDLNLAFTAGRSGPGPNGICLVSVGYLVAGFPGAVVAWLAMITPAFLSIPLVRLVGARVDNRACSGPSGPPPRRARAWSWPPTCRWRATR
jgi:chromate transporter